MKRCQTLFSSWLEIVFHSTYFSGFLVAFKTFEELEASEGKLRWCLLSFLNRFLRLVNFHIIEYHLKVLLSALPFQSVTIADLGGVGGRVPLSVQSFNFHSVFGNIMPNNSLVPLPLGLGPLRKVLDPSLHEVQNFLLGKLWVSIGNSNNLYFLSFRLTPVYMFVLLFYVSLTLHMVSGPWEVMHKKFKVTPHSYNLWLKHTLKFLQATYHWVFPKYFHWF